MSIIIQNPFLLSVKVLIVSLTALSMSQYIPTSFDWTATIDSIILTSKERNLYKIKVVPSSFMF